TVFYFHRLQPAMRIFYGVDLAAFLGQFRDEQVPFVHSGQISLDALRCFTYCFNVLALLGIIMNFGEHSLWFFHEEKHLTSVLVNIQDPDICTDPLEDLKLLCLFSFNCHLEDFSSASSPGKRLIGHYQWQICL